MAEFNDRGFNECNDIATIGEEVYKKKLETLKSNGKIFSYVDLRESKIARLVDCDFAVFTKHGGYDVSSIGVEWLILNYSKIDHTPFCKLVDVKTDTKILTTGNIFLEMLMHGGPGCFGNTRADYWIYAGIDGETNEIKKAWSIDIRKVREMVANGTLSLVNMDEYRSNEKYVIAYKVKIKLLEELGAAKEIKLL